MKGKWRLILTVAVIGCAAMGLCGCEKNTVDGEDRTDYIYGDSIEEEHGGPLWMKLGVPDRCEHSFDTGESGLSEISLVDDDIELTAFDRAYVVDFDRYSLNETDIKSMVERVFDRSKGIYCRDDGDENMTKAELQRDIDIAEASRKQAVKEGQTDVAELYEGDIEELKERQDKAPDTYAPVSQYGMNKIYTGMTDRGEYSLWISGNEDTGLMRGVSVMYSESGSQELEALAQVEGAMYVETNPESSVFDNTADLQNECSMTENAAESEALAFLSELGISGMACTGTEALVRSWQSSTSDTLRMEKNGYVFDFGCQISGIDVSYKDLAAVDNLQAGGGYIMQDGDRVSVFVDDEGVYYMSARLCTDTASFARKEVSLLSWDDMLAAADRSIEEYYSKYPTAYSKVEFDKVELLYVPEVKQDGGLRYIPAWVFTQSDSRDVLKIGIEYNHVSQVVYINAVDGKYIDIVETAKALGIWNDGGKAADSTISK